MGICGLEDIYTSMAHFKVKKDKLLLQLALQT